MVLVFFIYGLAFFCMGFAIALESRQSSGLRLAASLPFLAAFGILHALVEWADMFLLLESAAEPTFSLEMVRLFRTLMLGVSTGALLQFGARLLGRTRYRKEEESGLGTPQTPPWGLPPPGLPLERGGVLGTPQTPTEGARGPLCAPPLERGTPQTPPGAAPWTRFLSSRGLRFLPLGLGVAWVGMLALLVIPFPPLGGRQWLIHADIWARYLLYLPGSVLAGLGLIAEARQLDRTNFRQVALDARLAAATFLLNALLAGLVVPPGQRLPLPILDYDSFVNLFGLPVQVVRTASALAIAYFVLRVLRVFRLQSARQMEEANRRQLQAQQEALEVQKQARADMERWNRELEERIRQRTEEISLRNRQLLAVNSIAASVSQSFDLPTILSETLQKTLEALDAEGGGIFLSGQNNGEPGTRLSQGLPEDFVETVSRTHVDAVVSGQLADSRGPGSVSEGSEGEREPGPPASPHFFLTAPLKAKGSLVGVICVARTREEGFGSEDGHLLTAIGHQVGVAVENARLFAQVQNMAALEEREWLSREVHDGLAQVVGFLGLKTRTVRQLVCDGKLEQAERDLEQMQRLLQEAYADIRQAILSLRTATELDEGLLAAIRTSASDFSEQNSLPVELALTEGSEVSFPAEAEVQLVRIVQEALANVRKHSRATRAWIRLERRDGEILLMVEDDGVGFDPGRVSARKRRCFGLETMRERAESVGARLEVISLPGEGTRILVRFPSERRATEPNHTS